MSETEQRLSRAAEMMAQRERHHVLNSNRSGALARAAERGLELSGEQRAAFERVTDGRGLGIVVGYAGTGKSAMLGVARRSEEHTSELQSLMRISYAVFCLKKKKLQEHNTTQNNEP